MASRGKPRTTKAGLASPNAEATAVALLESAAQAVVTVDTEGKIVLVNAKTEEMFGYGRAELLGQPLEILLPEKLRTTHTAHRTGYFTNPRVRPMGIGFDLVGRRKDGSQFPIEVSLSSVHTNGERLAVSLITDITQRKQAEELLRRANETLEVVIQASPLAIWAADLAGNVTLWNEAAERMFGWTSQEVLGKLVPAIAEEDLKDLLETARAGEGHRCVERVRVNKDGSRLYTNVWTSPLKASDGSVRGVLAVVADVSEHKQLESQLRQSQKMEAIGRLAGGVAHDFNNLLTVITGYSDLILASLKPANPLRRDVEEIHKAGERAARLTNQLLAFSRRQVIQPRTLDLNLVIGDMQQMLRRTIGENCELSALLEPSGVWVNADPGQIEQVIVNLVLNARDAMPRGGRITIETANVELDDEYGRTHLGVRPGSYVMLAVSDQGQGMDEQTRSRIFEPFFTTKQTGTGLGLATVYGILKQNGGDIWVYSEPGFGSTFKIYLPRVAGSQEQPQRALHARAAPARTGTILLVEDEAGVRKLIGEMLARRGYQVLTAETGVEALKLGKAHPGAIDLLLTDVVMPQMGGRDLADQLLELRPRMKVLFMSGYTDTAIVNHGVLDPGTAFLQKPFTAELLDRKVREVLDGGARSAG